MEPLEDYSKDELRVLQIAAKAAGLGARNDAALIELLRDTTREKQVVMMRHLFWRGLKDIGEYTALQLAQKANRKDHSSVLHALDKLKGFRDIGNRTVIAFDADMSAVFISKTGPLRIKRIIKALTDALYKSRPANTHEMLNELEEITERYKKKQNVC